MTASKYRNKIAQRNQASAEPKPQTVITMVLPDGYTLWSGSDEDGHYVLTDHPAQGEKGNNITITVHPLMNTRIEFIEL